LTTIEARSALLPLQGQSSARRRIRASQAGATPPARHRRGFKRAWEAKDIGALVGLLDPDATAIASKTESE
jgi:hypothetical protein